MNCGNLPEWGHCYCSQASAYWVEKWIGTSAEGGWMVKLVMLPDSGNMMTAIGVLMTKDDGFELIRWIESPAPLGSGG